MMNKQKIIDRWRALSSVKKYSLLLTIAVLFGGLVYISMLDSVEPQTVVNEPAQVEKPQKANPLKTLNLNAYESQVIAELTTFTDWLKQNNAKGYIGEVGWPNTPGEQKKWNEMARKWMSVADYQGLWIDVWATGSWWGDYNLAVYNPGMQRALSTSNSQAKIVEAASADNDNIGINIAGLEFGTGAGFSNTNPGTVGQDYFIEEEQSFTFLKEKRITQIRIPFRWERLQPQPFGPLNDTYAQYIENYLSYAQNNDIKVVLDLHNYGEYITAGGSLKVGSSALPVGALEDIWLKISKRFGNHPAVLAYGLMNEPRDLDVVSSEPAKLWEDVSQSVVQAIRKSGDKKLIMVGGYEWSKLSKWTLNHADGWIRDPADNFRYEAHHYWDSDTSGTYVRSYQDMFSAIRQ